MSADIPGQADVALCLYGHSRIDFLRKIMYMY